MWEKIVLFKINLIRNDKITHKEEEQAKSLLRGAKRRNLAKKMLKEELSPYEVHIESLIK